MVLKAIWTLLCWLVIVFVPIAGQYFASEGPGWIQAANGSENSIVITSCILAVIFLLALSTVPWWSDGK